LRRGYNRRASAGSKPVARHFYSDRSGLSRVTGVGVLRQVVDR